MQGVEIMNKKEIKLSNGCDCHSKKWKGRTCTAELGGGKGSSDSGGICQIRCCFSGTSEKKHILILCKSQWNVDGEIQIKKIEKDHIYR